MAYVELINEEIKYLSDNDAAEVLDFAKFLRGKHEEKKIGLKLDLLKGGLKYMAEDFDETPDCFEEYM